MKELTIGQLAKQTGVQVETVKFYQRRGLIEQPPRPESGFRKYSTESVRRIRFIRHAKELGFSLREIEELLNLRITPEISCHEIKARAEAKLADIHRKQKNLEKMEIALRQLADTCQGRGPLSECPILGALDEKEKNHDDET
ncbi:MAG: heavy metal-responsive transcriptional regulator [Deltaproteobacteria bacterium]|nr:MAG: heavy metal-responsive transcriptional regulator [Deltaproteobacteria bacterium]